MQFRNYQLYACMAVLLPFQAATAQDNENVLEEITITGSRANFSSAQDAPVPVTVLTNEMLSNTGATELGRASRWRLLLSTSQVHQSVTARMHCALLP